MLRKTLTPIFVFCFILISSAQNNSRSNIWYFGYGAGLDFSSNPPSFLGDGALSIREGCATICDCSGAILLYTDGINIWNRNHQIIPGATNLGGDNSSTQSGIIVPAPNSTNLLYVFSVDDRYGPGGIQWSLVDLNLNGGLGGMVTARNVLIDRAAEKITAIPHSNGVDFWIIIHEYNNNNFRSYLLTEQGISNNPVISSIGSIHSSREENSIGCMSASPDGRKIAAAVFWDGFVEVFDFNNTTGNLSNPLKIQDLDRTWKAYGVEFSPNGRFLYTAGTQTTDIYQTDLYLPDESSILNSMTLIGENTSLSFGTLQAGPDGKIYVTQEGNSHLSVINNPNEPGSAANYNQNAIFMEGQTTGLGLPNLIPSFFSVDPSFNLEAVIDPCMGTASIASMENFVSDSIIYQWFFDDEELNELNSVIQVAASGNYRLQIEAFFDCQPTPIVLEEDILVELPNMLTFIEIQVEDSSCGDENGSITIVVSGGIPPYTYSIEGVNTQNENTFSSLIGGTYNIEVVDSENCMVSNTVEVGSTSELIISTLDISPESCAGNDGSVTVILEVNQNAVTFSLDNQTFQPSNRFENLSAGQYSIFINDGNGCQLEQDFEISQEVNLQIMVQEIIPTTCNEANGAILINGQDGVPPYMYSIDGTNFQSNGEFSNLEAGTYTIFTQDVTNCQVDTIITIDGQDVPSIEEIITTQPNCGEANGQIEIIANGGLAPITYSISGYGSQMNNNFENLEPGTYILQIIDSNNCEDQQTEILEDSDALLIDTINTTNAACGEAQGQIIIEANGGTPPYTYSIDGINFLPSNVFNNLTAGTYTIFVNDDGGCNAEVGINLAGSPAISFELVEVNPASCNQENGSFQIAVDGGTGELNLFLGNVNVSPNSTLENLAEGNYILSIQDELNCQIDTSIFISSLECPVYVPNVFSPNDDGINDFFEFGAVNGVSVLVHKYFIFDRWGELVYEAEGFPIKTFAPWWDGTMEGEKMDVGVYVYQAEVQFDKGQIKLLKGEVLLIR